LLDAIVAFANWNFDRIVQPYREPYRHDARSNEEQRAHSTNRIKSNVSQARVSRNLSAQACHVEQSA